MQSLDVSALRAFVLIAELKSFTRAAEALESTQSAVSLKLKRLERELGRRLVERTPRLVRLSGDGAAFLEAARAVVAAHERAVETFTQATTRLVVGISYNLVGADLPLLLKRLGAFDPTQSIELRLATSREINAVYDAGDLDAAIVLRQDDDRRDGEVLFAQAFGWFATPDFARREGAPLPVAMQAAPCIVRSMTVRALDEAGVPYAEAFIGGGAPATSAAAAAGVAVAPLARQVAPQGTEDVAERLSLPPLGSRDVVLHAALSDARSRAALRGFTAAFRAGAAAGG
jgi:DNA-binding transcriptional LysR family regulator